MTTCICAQHLAPLRTLDEVRARSNVTRTILQTCEIVGRGDWNVLERCRVCGRFWVVEWPYGEHHGSGPACAFHIDRAELPSQDVTADIRQRAEDAAFFGTLGPEIGPERCRIETCARLRIRNSVFCAQHHFESIKGRPAPAAAGGG